MVVLHSRAEMRNPERIPIVLAEIKRVWETSPDLRLGQLVSVLSKDKDIFYIEDDELIKNIKDVFLPSQAK
jgi:hypothetical protein